MSRRRAQQASGLAATEHPAVSQYERAMSKPEVRSMYLNTTQGILYGDPDREETKLVREQLNSAVIAYLFSVDISLPRPMFRTDQLTCVGSEEISYAISCLSDTSS